ncbi:cupin domain-containing protein [Nocardia sp. NPDC088792]|uniref:cupin domain-containing protein n=1 Tax=Nocardia sp. NPDC088792 TaxID=3364332 RepID=UPI00380A66B8
MGNLRNLLHGILAGTVVFAGYAAIAPGGAQATPARGITGTTLSAFTSGNTDYALRELTIAPGGGTGWHFHDGNLYGVVRSGTLTHYDSSCAVDGTYGPGATIVEPSGHGYIHMGRNAGREPVVLDVLYVLPSGSPMFEDAPNPGCPFD